jgi:hypothetical protein
MIISRSTRETDGLLPPLQRQKLENLGFTFFGFRIHDVVYTDSSDLTKLTQSRGDFIPVIFENQADSIFSGREELEFSKVYATLDVKSISSNYKLSAGWEGTEFCQLNIAGLKQSDSLLEDEPSRLHYKVISSSKPGSGVDSEYVNTARAPPPSKNEKILGETRREWNS